MARVPEHLANRVDRNGVSGRTKIDAFLTWKSREYTVTTTTRIAQELVEALAPDESDRYDPNAYRRRTLTLRTDDTGMTVVHGLLDPASAAVVGAALAHYCPLTSHPHPTGHDHEEHDTHGGVQTELSIRDERTKGTRNADALTALCEAALRHRHPAYPAHPGSGTGPGAKPAAPLVKVVVVATTAQILAARRASPPPLDLDGVPLRPPGHQDPWHAPTDGHTPGSPSGNGPPGNGPTGNGPTGNGPPDPAVGMARLADSGDLVTTATLGRLMCDAEFQTVVLGSDREVLALGRSTRLASKGQRTALAARDRGCVVPGCPMPATACQAHHVTWWRNGGGTDIDNLALVCSRHHTLIHTGEWRLQMRGGVPYVVAPFWMDPTRTPRRNTTHDAETQARHLGHTIGRQQQLPLD